MKSRRNKLVDDPRLKGSVFLSKKVTTKRFENMELGMGREFFLDEISHEEALAQLKQKIHRALELEGVINNSDSHC